LDIITATYATFGLAACALALIGVVAYRRNSGARQNPNETLLNAIIERQSPGPGHQRSGRPASTQRVRPGPRPTGGDKRLAMLEGHLRNAILDANARERLVIDAMRVTHGNRTAAIDKVLRDLHGEDKRLS
jgi:hypothetical protein